MTPEEEALTHARERLRAHRQRPQPTGACSHDGLDRLARLTEDVRAAERALCAARGAEYAEPWDQVPLLRRTALPRVFHRDRDRISVIAVAAWIPREWRGKIVGDDLSYDDERPAVRIDFREAQSRWAPPAERHPLLERGLDPSRALRVLNSAWPGSGTHHLLSFEQASLEVRGLLETVEVWTVTQEDAASRCGGRPSPGPA